MPKVSKTFILEILWVSYVRINFTKTDGFVGKNGVSQSQNLTSKFEVREGACISLQNSDDRCSLFEILVRYFQVWERNVLAFPDNTQKFYFYFAWAWSPLTIHINLLISSENITNVKLPVTFFEVYYGNLSDLIKTVKIYFLIVQCVLQFFSPGKQLFMVWFSNDSLYQAMLSQSFQLKGVGWRFNYQKLNVSTSKCHTSLWLTQSYPNI